MTRSDQDGVLTWVLPEVGATVRKGDVLARVADLSAYRVVATISDVHASKLAAGMRTHVKLDETTAGPLMFRDHSRRAPVNLYAHVNFMYGKCGPPVPSPPLFTYRAKGAAVGDAPTASVRVGFLGDPSFAVTWTWDAASGTWKRSIFGEPEDVATGTQLAPKNVVVMFVSYVGGDAAHSNIGAEAVLTGHGTAVVFTAGKEILGTWSRPDKAQPAQLLDAAGNVIPLTPGQTWVELPRTGYELTETP